MLNYVGFPAAEIASLREALRNAEGKIGINIATAINKTAAKVRSLAAKELKSELNVPVGVLKSVLKSKGKATNANPRAVVRVSTGFPIPLRFFKGTSQTKKGVTFRVKPKGTREIMAGAFVLKRYESSVYKRVGKQRKPLVNQVGPSPSEAFKSAGLEAKVEQFARTEFPKQINERVRLALLRDAGKVRKHRVA